MKYLKYGANADDVTGENIKSSSSDSRSVADKLNIHEITVSGEDLNDYKNHGIYVFSLAAAPTNKPIGSSGFLIVLPGDLYVKQIWIRTVSSGTNYHQTYVRDFNTTTNAWGTWKRYGVVSSYGAIVNDQGGFYGYNGYASNANNTFTQGQYHVNNSTTGLPAGASKYGILQVMVGDGGIEQNDSNAHSWCTQVYYSNGGGVYTRTRTKTSASWTIWRAAVYGPVDTASVKLSTLTWSSAGGMYYSNDISLDKAMNEIESVCIKTWNHFTADLFVQPYISGNKVALMCNKNTGFGNAEITIRVSGSIA